MNQPGSYTATAEKIKQEMLKTLNELLASSHVTIRDVSSNALDPLVTIMQILQKKAPQLITQVSTNKLVEQLESLVYTQSKDSLSKSHPVVNIMQALAETDAVAETALVIFNTPHGKLAPIHKALQLLQESKKLTDDNVLLLRQNWDHAIAIAELILCIDSVGALQPTIRATLLDKVKGTDFLQAHNVAMRLKEMQLLNETTVLKLIAAADWNPNGFATTLQQLERIDPTLYTKENIEVLVKVAIKTNSSTILLNESITALSDLSKAKSLNAVTRAMLVEHPDRAQELVQSPLIKDYMHFRDSAPKKQTGMQRAASLT